MPDQSRSPRSVTSPRSITESRPPVGRICQYNLPFPSTFPHPLNSPLHPAVNTSTNFFSGGYERLVVTVRNVNHLDAPASDSTAITTTTRTLLAFGVVLELLGILLAICFIQSYHPDEGGRPRQAPSTLARLVSGVPIVLILTGIIGLAAALVVETFKVSLSIAIIMSGCLRIGVILCLLAINGRL
ncbi:hypothetical protein PILCRDRAFT_820527 [Piloderma croceum F 1598]|uniref:Uncharacterized protein n=1 Tax=Piloderma croceum (strain F 1598) TaxID=765440 RepID=A0A0C3FR55_PILCF|nr:hypothetical protein PILCRDRAFT_820527 [Piloderma croceum F 1598]